MVFHLKLTELRLFKENKFIILSLLRKGENLERTDQVENESKMKIQSGGNDWQLHEETNLVNGPEAAQSGCREEE